jgi:stage II sporulation protein R
LLLVACLWEYLGLKADQQTLQDSLIRLHVVAASDKAEDQQVKLKVRDAVVSYVDGAMQHVMTVEEAKTWLRDNLPAIQQAANDVLHKLGLADRAVVTFQSEAFPVRHYDTFSLPSGVYDALRVTIGEGKGQNWWCVVFPSLCLPAAGESTEDVAAGAGFSEELTDTVTQKPNYRIRFFFMDVIGKIENLFFQSE